MTSVSELIGRAQFRVARRGYDTKSVDELLALIAESAEAERPFAHLLSSTLPVTRRGYRQDDVDELLDELLRMSR